MTRTRTFGPTETWADDAYTCTTAFYNGHVTESQTVPFSNSYRRDYLYKSMDDVSTVGFENLKRRGAIVCNPMSKISRAGVGTPCHLVASAKWLHYSGSFLTTKWAGQVSPMTLGLGDAATPYGTPSSPTTVEPDLQELMAEAYSRMSNTPFNVWVAAGEMRENIEMIRVTLGAIHSVMHVRARDFLKLKALVTLSRKDRALGRLVEEVSGLWLHLRYGVRPFIADLTGLLKALQTCGDHARARFSSREAKSSGDAIQSMGYAHLDNLFYFGREAKVKVTCTARAGVLCEPAFENLTLADLIGVGNYVQGAWDLIPYSFVVDWFFNVSALLATWSPNVYVHPLCDWVVVTTVTEKTTRMLPTVFQVVDAQGEFNLVPSSVTVSVKAGSATIFETEQTRLVNVSKAFIPSFRLKVGAAKVLDLLALARQFSHMR